MSEFEKAQQQAKGYLRGLGHGLLIAAAVLLLVWGFMQ